MTNKQPIGYVLLSGGLDSTTALAFARRQHEEVRCVSINYGQRHARELAAAEGVARFYGVPHVVLPLPIALTMLTDSSIPVPDIPYSEITGVSPTYVPFRNGMMLSRLAAHISEMHLDPSRAGEPDHGRDAVIYWGAHAEDAAGWAYPDCTPEFIGAMACAIYIGTYHHVRVTAPLSSMTKDEVVRLANRLGAPLAMTWSCYKGGEVHCGTCATCRARRDAFIRADMHDPTIYLT